MNAGGGGGDIVRVVFDVVSADTVGWLVCVLPSRQSQRALPGGDTCRTDGTGPLPRSGGSRRCGGRGAVGCSCSVRDAPSR